MTLLSPQISLDSWCFANFAAKMLFLVGATKRPRDLDTNPFSFCFLRSTRKSRDIYRGLNHLLQSVIATYGVWNFQLAKWRSIMNRWVMAKSKIYVGQLECPRALGEPEARSSRIDKSC